MNNKKLWPYLSDRQEISEYIYELIEQKDYESAFNNGNKFIENGHVFVAEILASSLFSIDCPFENDKLWTEYINKCLDSKCIIDVESCERVRFENLCGLWVIGHHNTDDYMGHISNIYGESVNCEDVVHAFMHKEGKNLFYSKEKFDYMVPITTYFPENISEIDNN